MRVLIGDDDDSVLVALKLCLRREGFELTLARSPAEVLSAVAAAPFDALLLDLNYQRDTTSGKEGFSLLERLRVERPELPVVVMTGWATIDGAVQAMRLGAVDYLPKPWDNERLVALLRRFEPTARQTPASNLTLASPEMRRVLAVVEQVAFSDVPVLITGEHGTGKEIVARLVHERSNRRGAFVPINAGALPEGTFESELFGHVRGAFTDAKSDREGAFSRARNGTLFLDEIANMPSSQQAKLLRVLQERTFQPLGAATSEVSTARIVSATNANLEAVTASGNFRADLMYRLNAIHLHLHPLRERREDIALLVDTFVRRETERYGLAPRSVDAAAMQYLESHDWPGNVRELEHAIQRAVLLSAKGDTIALEHLEQPGAGGHLSRAASASASAPTPTPTPTPAPGVGPRPATPERLDEAERAAILRALERYPDDRAAAAKSLGLSRSAFYRRLALHGIRPGP